MDVVRFCGGRWRRSWRPAVVAPLALIGVVVALGACLPSSRDDAPGTSMPTVPDAPAALSSTNVSPAPSLRGLPGSSGVVAGAAAVVAPAGAPAADDAAQPVPAPPVPATTSPAAPSTTAPLPVVSVPVDFPEPVIAGRAALERFGLGAGDVAVVVDPASQQLFVSDGTGVLGVFGVSTGASGLSSRWDSGGTPTGAIRVESVVDGGWGERFEFAKPTGRFVDVSGARHGAAHMTTRVITLQGVETSNASTRARGIYIHGTNLEGSIGAPRSAGCVRMANADVIAVADMVSAGTWMYVLDRPFAG